jgi:hypothetical protein
MTWKGKTDLERRIPWEKSPDATQFARELIDAKLEPLVATVRSENGEERITSDHGVMLLRTSTPLLREEVVRPHHFSRRCLREIWDEVARFKFERGRGRFDAIIVGAPGSGKSRSIVYGLKKLFEAGRTVVLELRRDKNVFAFVPKKTANGRVEYTAWWCEASGLTGGNCAALKSMDSCNIMDATAKLPKNPSGDAQRILVSEPNEENYDDMNKELAETRFVPPWTLEEMCALQEHWSGPEDSKLDRAELLQRFYILGGLPRFVFSNENVFRKALDGVRVAVENLTVETADSLLKGKLPADRWAMKKNNVSSQLVTFFSEPPFHSARTDFVSAFARAVTLSHVYEMLLNSNLKAAGDKLFEQAALGLLARSGSLLAKPLPYTEAGAKQEVYETIKFERGSYLPQVTITRAAFVSAARKLKTEAEIGDDAAPLIVPGASNQPAVDAADARDRFYQITQSPKHDIDCKALKELYTDESGAKRKIKLVFVVHPASKLSSAQRLVGSDDEKREAMEFVQQFVAKVFDAKRVIEVAAPDASAPKARLVPSSAP